MKIHIPLVLTIVCLSGVVKPARPQQAPSPTYGSVWILNPYREQQYWIKGQTHTHSSRHEHPGPGSHSRDPSQALAEYGKYGYSFACLTDHHYFNTWFWESSGVSCNQTLTDPHAGILYIPSMEAGRRGPAPDLLYLGIPGPGCYPTSCDGGCQFPTKQDRNNLAWFIRWIDKAGGLAVAPHALAGDFRWKEEWLSIPWLRGMEVHTDTSYPDPTALRSLWDRLLAADTVRWGFINDDNHALSGVDGRGYVMVNAPSQGRSDVLTSMRDGNFYAVQFGTSHDPLPPEFIRVEPERDGTIVMCVRNTRAARVRTRDGFSDLQLLGTQPPPHADHQHLSPRVNGSEGYVRFELTNGAFDDGSTVAYSQPLFVGGSSREPLQRINAANLAIRRRSRQSWYRLSDGSELSLLFARKSDAERVKAIMLHYGADGYGEIGSMQYLTVAGNAPTGPMEGEDCTPIYSPLLTLALKDMQWDKVKNYPMRPYREWVLVGGTASYFGFGDSQPRAWRALEYIRKHRFNQVCYVGREHPPATFVYLRN